MTTQRTILLFLYPSLPGIPSYKVYDVKIDPKLPIPVSKAEVAATLSFVSLLNI